MENWYVVYVKTGCEEAVAACLRERLQATYEPFVPLKVLPHRVRGKTQSVHRVCFPGYVFLRTAAGGLTVLQEVAPELAVLKDAYRFLYYGEDRGDMALREQEQVFLRQLLNEDFVLDASVGVQEGDRVRIISGVLLGRESVIKSVNRHRRTAVIEVEIMGALREITLMLEIVEKAL
jgi:transcriptional antiterminator NusG